MKYAPVFIVSLAGLVAAATGSLAQLRSQPWSLFEAEQVAGHQVFRDHCAACHVQKAGARRVLGPALEGVLDRPAGTVAGFPFSDALKKSGLVWTADNLRKWIADPARMVPETLMPHASVSDPAEQIYLVAYLKTLKAPARH
jgi:cytochrome c